MTRNQRSLDSAVMTSSVMPSEKYSWSGSPDMLLNGSTAIAGRSGAGRVAGDARPGAGGHRGFIAVRVDAHVGHEAQAASRDGTDQLLALAAVAQRLARGVDTAGQSRLRDDAAAPNGRNEIVLCDNPVTV